MAESPKYKVYGPDGIYQGALKDATLAAACVSLLGAGSSVRYEHRLVIWREGWVYRDGLEGDGQAGESYDGAAQVMYERLDKLKSEGKISA